MHRYHADVVKARKYNNDRNARDPKIPMLQSARKRAKELGIPFDLTKDDFHIPDLCPVLGMEMRRNVGHTVPAQNSPSLDRIIPERGYVRGNVVVVSLRCNRIKYNATVDELLKVAAFYDQLIPH